MTEQLQKRELKGWHVLLWMLGFFGLMIAVNGVFLFQAIKSFPGEDTPKSYLQGLNYNDALAARAEEAKLGWRAEFGVDQGNLIFRVFEKDGAPVSGHSVGAVLRRSATTRDDMHIEMQPAAPGTYIASAEVLVAGQWEASVHVMDHARENTVFTARKTLMIE